MSSSSSISLRICSRPVAFADHPLRRDAGDAVGAAGGAIERRVGFLVGFRAHDVGDAEPLLVAVLGLDHAQHDHAGADARDAAAGVIDGAVAFRRIVDDDEKFRLVAGFRRSGACGSSVCPRIPASNGGTTLRAATSRGAAQAAVRRIKRRTKPTMSLTAFMVSAASARARCGAVGQHRVDIGGIVDQPLHLGADRAELRDGQIDQRRP